MSEKSFKHRLSNFYPYLSYFCLNEILKAGTFVTENKDATKNK